MSEEDLKSLLALISKSEKISYTLGVAAERGMYDWDKKSWYNFCEQQDKARDALLEFCNSRWKE